MLLHAPWGGRHLVQDAHVLDVFAGTGALGLEALSRGAARAGFIERDRAALTALRANIAACRAGELCTVLAGDALAARHGTPCGLVFLDPPYGQDLVPRALERLAAAGWIAPGAVIVAETDRNEALELPGELLAERAHGAARITIWRMPPASNPPENPLSPLRGRERGEGAPGAARTTIWRPPPAPNPPENPLSPASGEREG